MKFIKDINKYSYNNIILNDLEIDFLKLSNGIEVNNVELSTSLIEYANGDKYWYKNGKLHRENDKPAIELFSSGKSWWINDNFIKCNWDKFGDTYSDKFFDWSGNEIH